MTKEASSRLLITCALVVKDAKKLDYIIKRMRRGKFKDELKSKKEIKGSKCSDALVEHMLEQLNKVDAAIFYSVADKRKLTNNFLKTYKPRFYNFVCGFLVDGICKHVDKDSRVSLVVDKSKEAKLMTEFNHYLKNVFKSQSKSNEIKTDLTITHGDSVNYSGLQFADVVAWCCFQKHERDNPRFMNKLTIKVVPKILFQK